MINSIQASVEGSPEKTPPRAFGARIWFRRLHLAFALICGAILAVVGISGSLLVVYQPILALEYGDAMFGDRPTAPNLPIEQWAGAFAHQDPAISGLAEITAPHAAPLPNDRPMLLFQKGDDAIVTVIDPDTTNPVGSFTLGEGVSPFLYYLHSQLVLSQLGATIVSLSAVGLLASIVTGMWLWWPKRSFIRALRPRQLRGLAALLQWHNLVGVYAVLGFLFIGISGIWITRPAWIEAPTSFITPLRAPVPTGAVDDCLGNLTFAQAATVARRHVPNAELRFIAIVPDGEVPGAYEVYMKRPGDHNSRLGDVHFEVGLHCPVVLAELPLKLSAGEVMRQSMLGIHGGPILGLPGRFLVFLAGLALPLLFTTGMILWFRRKARERRAAASRSATSI